MEMTIKNLTENSVLEYLFFCVDIFLFCTVFHGLYLRRNIQWSCHKSEMGLVRLSTRLMQVGTMKWWLCEMKMRIAQ